MDGFCPTVGSLWALASYSPAFTMKINPTNSMLGWAAWCTGLLAPFIKCSWLSFGFRSAYKQDRQDSRPAKEPHTAREATLSERHNGWDLSNQPAEGKEESVTNPPQPYTGLPATSPMSLTCIPNTRVPGLLKDNCTWFKVATKSSLAFYSMYSLTPAKGQKREQMT